MIVRRDPTGIERGRAARRGAGHARRGANRAWPAALGLAAALAACSRTPERDSGGGLPPADDWQAPTGLTSGATGPAASGPGDPHAGVDMGGGDPHAGVDMGGGDPHAGVDMGGGDPHAGVDLGGGDPTAGDPAMAGLSPPDPSRPIDPGRYLRGRITAAPTTAAAVKPGAILFISVKPIDPTTGDVIGASLAVDRLDLAALPVTFSLTEANSMIAGTQFAGDVVISARVDGDGEARTAEPGDVEGTVRARVPAENLELVLDRIIR